MPTYKLYYFNGKGRAEIARWLFAEAGAQYEDIRFSGDDWAKKKPECPFLQVPLLEVTDDSGKTVAIAESYAIYRYLAREFGLAGKSNLDVARADMICEKVSSLSRDLPYREQDQEKKRKAFEEALNGPLGTGFKMVEKYVQDNGFFVGDGVTIADIFFAFGCELLLGIIPNALEETPKLKALNERVRNLPRIKEWIAKRPDTPM